MDGRPNLFGLDGDQLRGHLGAYAVPAYHGAQVYRWMYGRGCLRPGEWTDLPRTLRERLQDDVRVHPGAISDRAEATDGTVKYRIELEDGRSVEAVYMEQAGRVTLCLSSQVGCALACDFCLTGKMGLLRHLQAGEILGQLALIRADKKLDESFNVVFMGMGEPLHNYDGVVAAFRILTDADGYGLSRRRVTVSTSGMVPAIERLAHEPVRPRLAVSLNATTDALRDRLMPINRKYPIARLLEACRTYASRTGEKFTLEYVLLAGVNDTDGDVARLAGIARRAGAKVNLIPFNPVPGRLPYEPPRRGRAVEIRDRLLAEGTAVSIRWSRGADARAACGQLALLAGD